jgi:hypothetical protein
MLLPEQVQVTVAKPVYYAGSLRGVGDTLTLPRTDARALLATTSVTLTDDAKRGPGRPKKSI